MLLSDPVIDFESSDCDTLIEADKIFFRFCKEKMRNLNLFIGFDEEKGDYYTSTFFLEMEPNKFRKKNNGEEQSVIYILSRMVINTMSEQIEDFVIKWENVRQVLSDLPCHRAQSQLKKWVSKKHIKSNVVEHEIEEQKKVLEDYRVELRKLQNQLEIVKLMNNLESEEALKELSILSLMDYGIDAENETELAPYVALDRMYIKNEKSRIESKKVALENKLIKFQKFLPELRELEIQEVIRAYQPYLEKLEFEPEIISKMFHEHEIYTNTLFPEKFSNLYISQKSKQPNAAEEAAATIIE